MPMYPSATTRRPVARTDEWRGSLTEGRVQYELAHDLQSLMYKIYIFAISIFLLYLPIYASRPVEPTDLTTLLAYGQELNDKIIWQSSSQKGQLLARPSAPLATGLTTRAPAFPDYDKPGQSSPPRVNAHLSPVRLRDVIRVCRGSPLSR